MSDPRNPPPSSEPESGRPPPGHRSEAQDSSNDDRTRPIPATSDRDGDGIPDRDEHGHHTGAATTSDRDGDGIPDRDEHGHHTGAATTSDRDGDGIPDRDEHAGAATPLLSQHREAEVRRREEFGGFNIGADFFGWLIAVALTILIASIAGAVAAAVGESLDVNRTDAEQQAGTFGLVTAIALLVILMIAYYAGGYVAGRMSRYDGGRQGMGVWLIGLLVTLVAVGVGYITSEEYNIFDRVDLPTIPIPSDTLSGGGLITLAAVLIGTFLAALAGGKMGQRYHRKIDRVGLQDDRH